MSSSSSSIEPRRHEGLLTRVHRFAFYAGVVYAVVIALLAVPFVQRHVAYQHAIKAPWGVKFDVPEKYGLAPGKTLNTKLYTSDNETLGAWFILSDPFYQTLRDASPAPLAQPSNDTVQQALRTHPTVLFLHGAAATRAAVWRMQFYSTVTARLHTNVFAVDYRGFGDSTGTPSESGLSEDAYAAWNWLMSQGAQPENVLIVGHSLGTGVSSLLATRLAKEGIKPRGIALLAPFTSLATLLETYDIRGIPILQPLQSFAFGRKLLKRLLYHEFDTLSRVKDFHVPTFIAHATDDVEIPHAHSRTLLDNLLDPFLPPSVLLPSAPGAPLSKEAHAAFIESQAKRKEARNALVKKIDIPTLGTVEEFEGSFGRVVYLESMWGTHNKVGLQEGVQDVMATMFDLRREL
ncbi:alpha/beta-hydrolase [Obba rivulosa]|uniref:Alpha/beta-hydrolase n=1 Tax=Obba rivulosa TaxID=1052685 RepID=A0A8E2DL23_9APHY|nr:alpha/beta-hydrolase [Obba rivulosa]